MRNNPRSALGGGGAIPGRIPASLAKCGLELHGERRPDQVRRWRCPWPESPGFKNFERTRFDITIAECLSERYNSFRTVRLYRILKPALTNPAIRGMEMIKST